MSRRAGFTLVEVLVALAIAALVLSTAAALYTTATDATERLAQSRDALDREMNAHRWLDAVLRSADMTAENGGAFEGHADHLRFRTRVLAGDGWFESATIALAVRDGALVAEDVSGQPLVLVPGVSGVSFDYLARRGADAAWLTGWESRIAAPLAVRLRLRRDGPDETVVDTLLFALGVIR